MIMSQRLVPLHLHTRHIPLLPYPSPPPSQNTLLLYLYQIRLHCLRPIHIQTPLRYQLPAWLYLVDGIAYGLTPSSMHFLQSTYFVLYFSSRFNFLSPETRLGWHGYDVSQTDTLL